jgi:NAD(P)-dependent dehydrogenase (short-subunit alcohol dehydrogenase family)
MSQLPQSLFIITGAASGIGRATAVQAAAAGALVLATDVNASGLAQTQALIQAAGGQVHTMLLDVAYPRQITDFARQVALEHAGRRLILLNNAGVALGSGTFDDNSLADFEWVLSINLWGVIRMTKAFLPLMRAQNAGHIVNVSSVFGLFGMPESAAYSTAKFGVRGFSDALRNELRGSGIQVSTVFPGGVKTNITVSARIAGPRTPEQHAAGNRRFEKSARTTPEEAAGLILAGIKANRARILVGPDAHLLDWLTRLLPTRAASILLPVLRRVFESPGDSA